MRGKSRVPRMCTETKLLLDMCLALEGIIKPNFHSTLVELQINSIFPQLPEEGYGPFLLCSKKKPHQWGLTDHCNLYYKFVLNGHILTQVSERHLTLLLVKI